MRNEKVPGPQKVNCQKRRRCSFMQHAHAAPERHRLAELASVRGKKRISRRRRLHCKASLFASLECPSPQRFGFDFSLHLDAPPWVSVKAMSASRVMLPATSIAASIRCLSALSDVVPFKPASRPLSPWGSSPGTSAGRRRCSLALLAFTLRPPPATVPSSSRPAFRHCRSLAPSPPTPSAEVQTQGGVGKKLPSVRTAQSN